MMHCSSRNAVTQFTLSWSVALVLGLIAAMVPSVGIAANPTDCIVLITTQYGKGTGFICSMNGTNYVVTNTHVLKCSKEFAFKTLSGGVLRPLRIELADNLDVARLALPTGDYGSLAVVPVTMQIGDPVNVFGNSLGGDVVRALPGKIEGIGPDLVEVTCQFVAGNSGSPILSTNNSVVGVATYIAAGVINWTTGSTPFEKPRRFGIRLTNNMRWNNVPLDHLYGETTILADYESSLLTARQLLALPKRDDQKMVLECLRSHLRCFDEEYWKMVNREIALRRYDPGNLASQLLWYSLNKANLLRVRSFQWSTAAHEEQSRKLLQALNDAYAK